MDCSHFYESSGTGLWVCNHKHTYWRNQTYGARQLLSSILGSSHKSINSLLCDKFEDIDTSSNNDPA